MITEEHYEIAKANGIPRRYVYDRVKRYGWDIERAITQSCKKNRRQVDFKKLESEIYVKVLENFNKWNDVANIVERDTGYYYELKSILEDLVNISITETLKAINR